MATKHNILTAILLPAIMLMSGCTIEELYFAAPTPIDYRGEPVEAFLDITVGRLSVSTGTRADEEDLEDSEAERWVNDLWVFQYNASTGVAVADPIYVDMADYDYDQNILEDMPVTLSDNEGDESIVYVVTNTGSDTWGTDDTRNTETGLLASALPTNEPIFFTDTLEVSSFSIPMQGNSGSVKVEKGKSVRVPVSRMYAKLMIDPTVDIYIEESTVDERGDSTVVRVHAETVIYSVAVGNIPLYCRVGPLGDGGSTAASYPDDVQWVSRAFDIEETAGGDTGSGGDDTGAATGEPNYRYIVYLPENLQGQIGDSSTSKIEDSDAPSRALEINIVVTYFDPSDNAQTRYPYTVYPGANSTNDYNVKRNNIYRVKVNINELSEARVPSANCFFAYEGHTISFYPYYRVETGGGYDFTQYLDPEGVDVADGVSGIKIDHLGIVWQTKDCIGDNSDGSLVYLTNAAGNSSETHTGYEQIHVRANKEGNALIAAYDKNDNIAWSWHIWVRNEAYSDPTHPASALVYYTYDWDETGIYSYQREEMGDGATHRRIAGYELMSCNLGALQDEPNYSVNPNFTKVTDPTLSGMGDSEDNQTFVEGDGIVRTFGMLYQWGRKDPFPPMTQTLGCLAYGGYQDNGEWSNYLLPDSAINSGYYVHNYDDEHTEQLYGNDNSTEVHKTSYGDDSYLFHSHIHDASADVISGMRYSIAHPTVFLSGASTIAVCLTESISRGNADYTSPLNQNNISSDGSITNYAFGGAWSDEDHDNREWGGLEPDESTMTYYHLVYPDYTTTGTKGGQQITDNAGRTISLWDNYDNGTPEASKTIFDPCPYGWRVASGDLWLGFARNGISPYIDGDRHAYDEDTTEWIGDMSNINRDPTRSCGLGMTMYLGQEWMTEPTTWFPCQGFILPDGSGYRVGGCGNYVNANTDVSDRVNVVHFHDTFNSYRQFEVQTHYTAKSTGNPLRCVRDTK